VLGRKTMEEKGGVVFSGGGLGGWIGKKRGVCGPRKGRGGGGRRIWVQESPLGWIKIKKKGAKGVGIGVTGGIWAGRKPG